LIRPFSDYIPGEERRLTRTDVWLLLKGFVAVTSGPAIITVIIAAPGPPYELRTDINLENRSPNVIKSLIGTVIHCPIRMEISPSCGRFLLIVDVAKCDVQR